MKRISKKKKQHKKWKVFPSSSKIPVFYDILRYYDYLRTGHIVSLNMSTIGLRVNTLSLTS